MVFRTFICVLLSLILFSCGGSGGDDNGPLNNGSLITGFTVSGVSGSINTVNNIVEAVVTDPTAQITSLTPEITISPGATINPASGVSQDFTDPVTYTVTAEDGSTSVYTITVVPMIFPFTVNGNNYEFISQELTWLEAVDFAVNRGGFLVEIDDVSEHIGILFELTNNINIVTQDLRQVAWLGGNDRDGEGTWIFDGDNDGNGTPFWEGDLNGMTVGNAFANWGTFEPDDVGGQDALVIALEATARLEPGQWNDLDEQERSFFIIEFPN